MLRRARDARDGWLPTVSAGAMLLLGCVPLPETTGSSAPVNVCEGTCPGYASDAGVQCQTTLASPACQVNTVAPYVLVITPPTSSPQLGDNNDVVSGSTYVVSSSEIYDPSMLESCGFYSEPEYPGSLCLRLGAIQSSYGGYLVDEDQAIEAHYNLANPLNEAVTLPVSVTYWPQWMGIDARLLNLPLPPVFAAVGVLIAPGFELPMGAMAPGGTVDAINWIAGLPPALSTPSYVADVQVSPPFDQGYPNISYGVTVVASNPKNSVNMRPAEGVGASYTSPPLVLKRAGGGAFEGEWHVYFRSQNTLARLTSRATVTGTPASVRLNEIVSQPVDPYTSELVVEPPALSVLPTVVDQSPGVPIEIYPALPPILHVSGTVQSPQGDPVSANLLFFSSNIENVSDCEDLSSYTQHPLVYQAAVATADQLTAGGAIGSYTVDLPQGFYDVVIEPNAASGYAKTLLSSNLHVGFSSPGVCSGAPAALTLAPLTVSSRVPVSGTVSTGDGRPLGNATVVFTPAAALAPGRFQPITRQGLTLTPEPAWPRPFSTVTTDAGTFSVSLDPYGRYDMTVRPEEGSSLPWLVRPDHLVTPGMGPLSTVFVPAPYFLNLTLEDPSGGANLSSSIVTAYSFTSGVALPIGQAICDGNGHFTMMMSTSFVAD